MPSSTKITKTGFEGVAEIKLGEVLGETKDWKVTAKPEIKVVCIDATNIDSLTEGKTYTVRSVDLDGDPILTNEASGTRYGWMRNRFKKVDPTMKITDGSKSGMAKVDEQGRLLVSIEKPQPEFRIGDRVKYMYPMRDKFHSVHAAPFYNPGTEGVVDSIDDFSLVFKPDGRTMKQWCSLEAFEFAKDVKPDPSKDAHDKALLMLKKGETPEEVRR